MFLGTLTCGNSWRLVSQVVFFGGKTVFVSAEAQGHSYPKTALRYIFSLVFFRTNESCELELTTLVNEGLVGNSEGFVSFPYL